MSKLDGAAFFVCGQLSICILFFCLSHCIKTTRVSEQHVQLQHSSSVLMFSMHTGTHTHIQRVNELLIPLSSSKLPLFTHKEYCTLLYSSLRLPCDSQRMTGFLSCFQIARYTLALYFQVIIIVRTATVSDWVVFVWFPVKFCCKFKLHYWPPTLLLLEKKKS